LIILTSIIPISFHIGFSLFYITLVLKVSLPPSPLYLLFIYTTT